MMRASKLNLVRFAGGLAAARLRAGWSSGSNAILLHAAIESTAAQTERLRCMADVSGMPRQRLLNEKVFYFFQAHIFYFGRTGLVTFQAQVGGMDQVTGADQHGAFGYMVQLTDVPGPEMLQH